MRIGDTLVFSARGPWRAWLVCAAAAAARMAIAGRAPYHFVPRLRRGWERFRGWSAARRQDAARFYGLLTLVAIWLATGSPGGLWRYVYWWPGMNFIRVPSRFMV